jgi:hypothetical protein
MSLWTDLARVAVGVNVVILLALGYVWGRNYLRFRSKHTLGLLVFATFLLAENALALYTYFLDPTLSQWWYDETKVPTIVWQAQMALNVLQTLGLGFLAWITWD